MPRIHPKTWDDGVMPLEEFPPVKRADIATAVSRAQPPSKWLSIGCGQIVSRAWWEWHWSRGRLLRWVGPAPKPRRAISFDLRESVYERDGHSCLHCGAADDLTLDHIYPFSLGGEDTFENLQTLCRSCNSRKGARV